MKKLMMMGLVAIAGSATVLAQTLAEARGKIDQAIGDAAVMGEQVKGLSAAEQKQFLADVNKAISDMPGSVEEKAAKFLNANKAALKSAQKGNLPTLLAEVFATVPPEALTVINERFASDLLNRAANPKVTYTDDQFTNIAVSAMQKINDRAAEVDNSTIRSVFGILTFLRASNGSPADLVDTLVDMMKDDASKKLAKEEWIPAALGGETEKPDYEPLLSAADVIRAPCVERSLVIAGPQFHEALLADLNGMNTDIKEPIGAHTPILDAELSTFNQQIPTLGDDVFTADIPVPPDGKPQDKPVPPPPPPPPPHPIPYGGQSF